MVLFRLLWKYLKALVTAYGVCHEWVTYLHYDHPNLYRLIIGFVILFWIVVGLLGIAIYALLWAYLWIVALIATIIGIAFLVGLVAEDF